MRYVGRALPGWGRGRLASLPWGVLVPVAVFGVFCLAGVSQSSIGAPELRQDPADPAGAMLGEARAIRSDEFLTSTPLNLGVAASGKVDDLNPLTAPQEVLSVLPAGPVTAVLFLDGTALQLGPWLPDHVLLSARLWLGVLLLVLAVPVWFREITGSRWIGWFAVALIVFSPHNAWWSNSPATILGFAFAGAVALQRAASSVAGAGRIRAVAWGALSGALLTRTPLLYPPWAVVLVASVLITTVAFMLAQPDRRRSSLSAIGGVGTLTVVLLGAVLWENWEAVRASAATIYPGERVTTGAAHALQAFFGATNLGVLTEVDSVVASNQSEISSGYTVCLVVALMILCRGLPARGAGHRWAVLTLLAATAGWTMWATVDFGELGYRIPLVNTVPSGRAAQVLGHLGVMLLCLVLPATASRGSTRFAALAAGTAALVSAYAGSLLRAQNIPELSVTTIWAAAIALGVVVFLVVRRPRAPWGYVLGATMALSLVWNVNPLLFGLADLRGSQVAQRMLSEGARAREDGSTWAADGYSVDSLLMATGVPSVSGRQMSGPDTDEWIKLDPGGGHEEVWNRGGSYIWFTWTADEELSFANPSPDAIHVTGSPCVVAERLQYVRTIVASRELDHDCLRPEGTFAWGGSPRWVYAVR